MDTRTAALGAALVGAAHAIDSAGNLLAHQHAWVYQLAIRSRARLAELTVRTLMKAAWKERDLPHIV